MLNERGAERTNADDGDSSDPIRRLRRRREREQVDDINPPTEAVVERRAFGRPTERSRPNEISEVGISQRFDGKSRNFPVGRRRDSEGEDDELVVVCDSLMAPAPLRHRLLTPLGARRSGGGETQQ